MLAIGCSNEGTTGTGNTGNNEDQKTLLHFRASGYDYSGIVITNSQAIMTNRPLNFTVYEGNTKTSDYDVVMQKVTNRANILYQNYGGELELTTNDFIFNKTANTLTLSTDGLNKFKDKQEITNYSYYITFKFTTSSEVVSNKETTCDVWFTVENVKPITKDEFESMMQKIGNLSVYGTGGSASFSFASFTLESSSPHFSSTATSSGTSYNLGSTAATIIEEAKKVGISLGTWEYAKYSANGKDATFTFPIGGYFEDDIKDILSGGLSIKLTLPSNGSWN